jgi:hypothetical protein
MISFSKLIKTKSPGKIVGALNIFQNSIGYAATIPF